MTQRLLRLSRRALLAGTGAFLAAPALGQGAWPNRPVRIFVPFAAGGVADVTTRIVAERLSAMLGQQFTVMNQPGPGGTAAANATLQGGPDGHSLVLLTNGTAVSVPLLANMGFDPVTAFTPVSQLGQFDFVFAAAANGPHATFQALLADARARPDGINVGTILLGSTQHLSAVLFGTSANLRFTHVPYRASPELVTGAIRGDVAVAIDAFAALRAAFAGNQLRPLAISGARRASFLPDVPTVAEAGVPGYDVSSWNGLFAPTGTPPAVITRLGGAIREVLADADVRRRFLEVGIEAQPTSPEDLGRKLVADIARWGEVIRRAGIERQ
jgi:tripartite-type tricarboxylate transporter receptor subunit TctC